MKNENKIHIINLPCTMGQPHPGVALTNTQIRNLFPADMRSRIEIDQVLTREFVQYPSRVLLKCIEVQRTTVGSTLFFGGDHYASFFTILSSLVLYGNNFRLVWLDAHGDIHSPRSSPSGNKHGMVLRFLMRHTLFGVPRLRPEQILYVGIRDLERAEWQFIHRHRIQYITAAEICGENKHAMRKIAKFVRGHRVHISLDVDVLDPAVMPCTGTLAADGLSVENLFAAWDIITHDGTIVATDIMELDMELGDASDKKTARTTMAAVLKKIFL